MDALWFTSVGSLDGYAGDYCKKEGKSCRFIPDEVIIKPCGKHTYDLQAIKKNTDKIKNIQFRIRQLTRYDYNRLEAKTGFDYYKY